MNIKEKLTEATIKALQGKLTEDTSSVKEKLLQQLKDTYYKEEDPNKSNAKYLDSVISFIGKYLDVNGLEGSIDHQQVPWEIGYSLLNTGYIGCLG